MERQKITTTILLVLEIGLLCAVLIIGMFVNATDDTKKPTDGKQTEQSVSGDETESSQLAEDEMMNSEAQGDDWYIAETREDFSDAVEAKLVSMTTEQKVAQLFLTTPEALTGVDRVTISGNGTREALKTYPVGGLIYSQMNFIGGEQAQSLIGGAQGYSDAAIGLPLFILINEDASLYAAFATMGLTMQERDAIALELGNAPAITAGIQTCTYTNSLEVVAAVKGGMNMIYAPSNFMEFYGAVLEAVNNGTITQVRLENAVGNVLTEKME